MLPNPTYRPLLAITIILLIAGLSYLALRWPQGLAKTFSQHAAAQRVTIFYYIGLFTLTLPLLISFFVKWFTPTFHLSSWVNILVIGSAILQYSVTLIPEVGSWKTTCHRILTFISISLLLPALALIGLSNNLSSPSRSAVFGALVTMIAIMVFLAIVRGQHRYLLVLQASYYAAFFYAILAVTYQ